MEKSSFCGRNWRKISPAVETGEKFLLRQKLKKDSLAVEIKEKSVCSRNWRKVPSAAETEEKLTLQRLPLDLDSTFAHKPGSGKIVL